MKVAEKVKGFGHYYWVVTLECANGHEMRMRAGRTKVLGHSRGPSLPPGATTCHCGARIPFR